jgi:hypothetical protein
MSDFTTMDGALDSLERTIEKLEDMAGAKSENPVAVQLIDRIRHAETFTAAALQAVIDARQLLGDKSAA